MAVLFIDDYRPVTITYVSRNDNDSGTTSRTYSNQNIGTAFAGRYIVVAATYHVTGSLSSVVIGGVTATVLRTASDGVVKTSIVAALLDTGTTADIQINLSASGISSISVFSLENWAGINYVTDGSTGDESAFTLTTSAGSAMVASVAGDDNLTTDPTADASWSGLTERNDVPWSPSNVRYYTSASANFEAAQTNKAISCDLNNTGFQSGVAVGFYN